MVVVFTATGCGKARQKIFENRVLTIEVYNAGLSVFKDLLKDFYSRTCVLKRWLEFSGFSEMIQSLLKIPLIGQRCRQIVMSGEILGVILNHRLKVSDGFL